jgi:alkanesulfonate monooxygenase
MIGVTPPAGTSLHVIRGAMSRDYLTEFTRAHEESGFDSVLVGYYASSAEGFNVALYRRTAKFNISFRPVIAPTEGEAWDKARRLLADLEGNTKVLAPQNESAHRLFNMANKSDVFDERLWMGIAKATEAPGNTTCLVGTPGQVAQAIAKYYRLGAESFLLRGFDPLNDTREFGRELIPMIRQECAAIDQERRVAA